MKTRIKKAFDEVRAEEQLKDRTREFLLREMQAQEAKMQVAGVQTQEPKAKNHTPAAKSQDLEPRASASEKARAPDVRKMALSRRLPFFSSYWLRQDIGFIFQRRR